MSERHPKGGDDAPTALVRRRQRRLGGGVFLALTFLLAGVALDRLWLARLRPAREIPAAAVGDFQLMAEAWNAIDRYYVDRSAVKNRSMTYGAIAGMVDSLGDTGHSTFLDPQMLGVTNEIQRGKLQGIGIEIWMKNRHLEVVAPLDGSPAERAGVRPGDIILEVDGQAVSGRPLSEVAARIAGPPGTTVKLRILTPNLARTRDISVERAVITLHGVTAQRIPGTNLLHVRIAQFSTNVTVDLERQLAAIGKDHLEGLVLDLRNDPGGLLDQAVGVASQFLPGGNVLLEKDALGRVTAFPVRPGGMALTVPVVVLINQGTASAAEIVAAALKDAGRARLVGETTFGTGTVLRQFLLSDGSALLLAIGEWLTPSGRAIWHKGIEPDQAVLLPTQATPLWPTGEQKLDAEQLSRSSDIQLLRAVQLLGGFPAPAASQE